MDQKFKQELARKIGHRLRIARNCRQLSIEQLATKSNLKVSLLRSYEDGRSHITIDELERLAEVLRLPVSHFLEACAFCGSDLTT